MTRVLCLHDQRAMEQRPRIAHRRDHTTVVFWCTRTARNHMPPGRGYQKGLMFYGQVKGKKLDNGWPESEEEQVLFLFGIETQY